jgi:putative endonuclease
VTPSQKGPAGEQRAAEFLEESGYRIVKRNFRIRTGEVDIIAIRDEVLAFVEVKTWDRFGFAELEYSINGLKQARIRRAAEVFLLRSPQFRSYRLRFDVILISQGISKIEHVEGAFDGT